MTAGGKGRGGESWLNSSRSSGSLTTRSMIRKSSSAGSTPKGISSFARCRIRTNCGDCGGIFSTFAARPVVNIHDFGVMPRHRGRGLGRSLLAAVESEAAKRGACKVTLEVLSGNEPAKALYRSSGFADYALDPAAGTAQFWQKTLP